MLGHPPGVTDERGPKAGEIQTMDPKELAGAGEELEGLREGLAALAQRVAAAEHMLQRLELRTEHLERPAAPGDDRRHATF